MPSHRIQILGSLDRPVSHKANRKSALIEELRDIQRGSEKIGSTLSYPIGEIHPDGRVTF